MSGLPHLRLQQAIKSLTVLSMLFAVGWLVSDWDDPGLPWEPLVVLIGLTVAYISLEVPQQLELTKAESVENRNDAVLFAQLLEILPSHKTIDFIKHHDFGGSFRLADLDPVQRFTHEWDNPQHEFNDAELESQRANLLRAAKYFSHAIAYRTAPRHGLQSVVPEHVSSEGPVDEGIKQDIAEIHKAAEALVDEHEKMVRIGLKKLPRLK